MTTLTVRSDNSRLFRGSYSVIVYIEESWVIAEDAHGNVIASGTAGRDDATILSAALTTVNDSGGGLIRLANSTFLILSTINLPDSHIAPGRHGYNIILEGMGRGTILKWIDKSNGFIISALNAWNFTAKNILFDGNNVGSGIYVSGDAEYDAQRNIYENLGFINCITAIKLGDNSINDRLTGMSQWRSINIDQCTTGIHFASQNANGNLFDGGIINGCNYAIYCERAGGNTIRNMELVSNSVILRKNIMSGSPFIFDACTEEANAAWFQNDNLVATAENALIFIGCILDSPGTFSTASFNRIISIGCTINGKYIIDWDTVWISQNDRINGSITSSNASKVLRTGYI